MVKQVWLDRREVRAYLVYLDVMVHLVEREMKAVTADQVQAVHLVSTVAMIYNFYRAMLAQSAVMRLHVVCLSVRLSVCL